MDKICICGHKESIHMGNPIISDKCCKVVQNASYKAGKNRDRVYCSCKKFVDRDAVKESKEVKT